MLPPRVLACFAESVRYLRARAAATIALSAGVVLALISVCCGMGVVMTPWLLCELLALTLATATGAAALRSRTWLFACAILLFAVLLAASVGWLSFLALGTDAPRIGELGPGLAPRLGSPGALLALVSSVAVLVFVLPFLYAPLILIESRSGFSGAVLESARLVARGGVAPHAALSLAAHALQTAPIWIAGLCAVLLAEDELFPLWMLFALPLLSLTIPLGQGMLVAAYVQRRAELDGAPRGSARRGGQSRALLALWAVLVAAPLLSFGMLGASLVRPSRLAIGELPRGPELVAELRARDQEQVIHPEGTALEIGCSSRSVTIAASDGGGAGALPLRSALPIESLRVVRLRDRYGVRVMQGGRAYTTWIDRAGVRQDDDLRARLLDRVPSWALLAMLASMIATASVLLPVLASFAEVRRMSEAKVAIASEELAAVRNRTSARAYVAALALAPLALLSLHFGFQSLF